MTVPTHYQCVICRGPIPIEGPPAHRLDPCAVVLVGNADRDWREQREQTYWCHCACFRGLPGADALYIDDPDFSSNGEIADEQAQHR